MMNWNDDGVRPNGSYMAAVAYDLIHTLRYAFTTYDTLYASAVHWWLVVICPEKEEKLLSMVIIRSSRALSRGHWVPKRRFNR